MWKSRYVKECRKGQKLQFQLMCVLTVRNRDITINRICWENSGVTANAMIA